MMHARALVRRLLRRRLIGESLFNEAVDIGQNLNRDAQARHNLGVGDFVAVPDQTCEGNREDRSDVPQFSNDLADDRLHIARVPYLNGDIAKLNGWLRGSVFNHVVPLDELNRHLVGQMSALSSEVGA